MIQKKYLLRKMNQDNHCISCNKLIWKNKSMKCGSCSHKEKVCGWNHTGIPPNIGKKHKPETIEKMKLAVKQRIKRDGHINSPKTRKKISKSMIGNIPWNKGKKGLQESWSKGLNKYTHQSIMQGAKKQSENKKGQTPTKAILFKKGHTPWIKGKKHSDNTKKKISLSREGKYCLDKNPAWLGGKSYLPYTPDWNEIFKEKIRERDNRCCVICNKSQEQEHKKLSVHHVDYDKKNSFPQNCVALCNVCHITTNINRNAWKLFFQSLLKERYNYEYSEDQKIILDFTKD